jgi:hypothetical protein
MRVFMVPMVAIGVLVCDRSDEPRETAMRAAFQVRLAADVQGALDFIAETSGPDGVTRVRSSGTDRFEIRSFKKLDCRRNEGEPGHVCAFAVDVSVVNGSIQRTLQGRFMSGRNGLVFADES